MLANLFPPADIRSFLQDSNQMGQTPLHYAVRNDLTDTSEFLIRNCQVNVNLSNKMGNTPLHVAVLNNRHQVAEMLINAKIDVLLENKEGYNVLNHSELR